MPDTVTRILVADDNRDTCRYIAQHLRMETDLPAKVDLAYDRDEALDFLRNADAPYHIVIADLWMPDRHGVRDTQSGIRILEASRAQNPPAETLIITGNSSADTALRASLSGAREYILKPIDYKRIIELVRQIVGERKIIDADEPDVEPREFETTLTPVIGASSAMIDVMKTLGRVAPTDADVLIEGESGSGKELIARTIHANSPRADKPFVIVNCAAIPSNLIESELFGIGRRVATDVDARDGKFMEAQGGTLFLDEIGEMSLDVQPKLLRAIEMKELQRVGGKTIKSDARIIAATNKNLAKDPSFRSDLYYRLSGVTIRVPPLRERRSDIPLLADFFLRQSAARLNKRILGFDEDVLPQLAARIWNGNVREFKNLVETAVLRCSGALVRWADFPKELMEAAEFADVSANSGGALSAFLRDVSHLPLDQATAEFERRLLRFILNDTDGNVTQAAKRLGIGRTALHRKMRHLGVRRPDGFEDEDP